MAVKVIFGAVVTPGKFVAETVASQKLLRDILHVTLYLIHILVLRITST